MGAAKGAYIYKGVKKGPNMMFFRHARGAANKVVTRYARDLQGKYICYWIGKSGLKFGDLLGN